jgi:phosphatidylinositol alpha-1,6-mannosyltransferase
MEPPRTLVITNDFPPRVGGVQQYVFNLVQNLPPDRVSVLAPNWPGWREHDAGLQHQVHRFPPRFLWPTRDLARRARIAAAEAAADVVLFGHGLPLGLLGPDLAREGYPYVVLTHGTEYWFSLLPGTAEALYRATALASRVTAISRFTGRVVRTAVSDRVPVSLLPPGVDVERFRPDVDGEALRRRYGLSDRPVVLCVSRLVRRKGQDVLIGAMPTIRRRVPDSVLLIVGDGPDRERLGAMAERVAPPGSVVFAGQVDDADLPAVYGAADVFAVPCRSRFGGLEVEGFGIVFLEAAACGIPAVAGDSGGAAEAVVDGETGLVVDGRHGGAVAEAVAGLLSDPAGARAMGKAARARAERLFAWPGLAARLQRWLVEAAA